METAARKLVARDPQPGEAVPDAVKPPPGNPRFPLFDGLRAIAALSIVVTHAAGATHANDTTWLGATDARLDVGVTRLLPDLGLPALPPVRGRAR